MFDFYQKRKLRNIFNSRYTQGLILFFVILVGFSAFKRYEIAMEMRDRRINAEQAAQLLQERKEILEDKVKYLSDERGIEAEMRRQFDVALEGEQVVVIVNDEEDEVEIETLSTTTDKVKKKKWYQFWR